MHIFAGMVKVEFDYVMYFMFGFSYCVKTIKLICYGTGVYITQLCTNEMNSLIDCLIVRLYKQGSRCGNINPSRYWII
jgi:hypothetical protein